MTSHSDAETFRMGMARLGAAVCIVTTDGAAGRSGLTVTAVCSVTDSPPTLLVCVNSSSRSLEVLKANGNLGVNVLRPCHESLAGRFSSRRHSQDARFAAGTWEKRVTGAPILADALVGFDCRIAQSTLVGSHNVLYCTVADIAIHDDQNGLFYFRRNLCQLNASSPGQMTA